MVTKRDFKERDVEAAKSVLIELIHILGEFKDEIVVIGGSVPPLLLPDTANEYVGTLDVDLAVNHKNISDDTYNTIRQLLIDHGYVEHENQPFIFFRKVKIDEQEIEVQVDFLSGEYGGTGKSHRTQQVQDIRTRKARGSDLVFDDYKEIELEGNLPGGGKDKVQCKISAIVPFIVMKGMALHDRLKEKDAWDIYYCLRNYPGEIDAILREFKPYLENHLVMDGLNKIKEKFLSADHIGPKHVADFENLTDEEQIEYKKRDSFERVIYLLDNLGI